MERKKRGEGDGWGEWVLEGLGVGTSRFKRSRRAVTHPYLIAFLAVFVLVLLFVAYVLNPLLFTATLVLIIGAGLTAVGALRGANPWLLGPGIVLLLIGALVLLLFATSGQLGL